MQTREQKILEALTLVPEDLERCKVLREDSKLRQLPSMLLRHGPAQVVIYLRSKSKKKAKNDAPSPDQELLRLYVAVLRRVLTSMGRKSPLLAIRENGAVSNDNLRELAEQPLADRLADQALCVEVANWLNRSIEARYQDANASKE